MCGLFGAISFHRGATLSSQRLRKLGEEMDLRGGDSNGWAKFHIGNKSLDFKKQLGDVRDHRRKLCKDVRKRAGAIVGHTRFSTHGSEKVMINNHPHLYENRTRGAVTHNGVIGDHEAIAFRHGLKLLGQCDSEIIARLIESYSLADTLANRCAQAVNACSDTDSIALGVIEENPMFDDCDLCLVARGNPIWYCEWNGCLYYASTKNALPNGKHVRLAEGDILHARMHVGILSIESDLMEKKSSIGGANWWTYGAGSCHSGVYTPKQIAKKDDDSKIHWVDS